MMLIGNRADRSPVRTPWLHVLACIGLLLSFRLRQEQISINVGIRGLGTKECKSSLKSGCP